MKISRLHLLVLSISALLIASGCLPQASAEQPTSAPPTKAPPTAAPAPTKVAAAPTAETAQTAAPELVGDMIRGGKLYDSWWGETQQEAPTENNPLWAKQTTDKAKGANTWKCTECHGWDYKGVDGVYGKGSHMTGFPGIMKANGKSPAENLAMLTGKINPDHDFSGVMEEQDLVDLALFVSKGTVDVDIALEKDGTPKGDVAAGKVVFDKICSTCHGPNGNAINFKTPAAVEYLNHPATENPWQFLHRTRIGVTLWPMPSAADNKLSEQDLANVLAYVRTLDKPALALGGGQLYDKWYTVLGVKTPADNMPLWKTQTTNTAKGASTWTCRECHGLDYLGKDGVYGSGKHMTGFPGLMDSASKSEADLTAALIGKTNPDHDFSKLMSEKDIAALVHFIKTEMFAIAPHVKADGITVDGDMAHGKTVFEQTCVGCHGKDGKLLNFKTAEAPEYVGTVAAGEPQVCLHRVTFGVPGFPMSAGLDLGLSVKDVTDVCAYAQTLPVK